MKPLHHAKKVLQSSMLTDFKAFIMRGNVVDMAVGIVIGAAFGAIVSSVVKDVMMPPIGMVLGFHPGTHRGMVAAITPVALPGLAARQLDTRTISRIRNAAYNVFQLDGTAYPGNSGSPVYDPDDGIVYGIINSVFVQGTRESAVGHPSGITYAIPSQYIRELLRREKLPGFDY